jgi:hypothetical protein
MPAERPDPPLVSTRADDPEVEEPIDQFVVNLGETVDHLQDAEADGDGPRLEKLADELAREAERLGYPPLAEAALRVAESSRQRVPEAAHKHVAEVTALAQRIRRGHHSAA